MTLCYVQQSYEMDYQNGTHFAEFNIHVVSLFGKHVLSRETEWRWMFISNRYTVQGKLCSAVQICNLGMYKLNKNPGFLRPFINMFNYFIGGVISYDFGSLIPLVPFHHFTTSPFCYSPFRVLNTPLIRNHCHVYYIRTVVHLQVFQPVL